MPHVLRDHRWAIIAPAVLAGAFAVAVRPIPALAVLAFAAILSIVTAWPMLGWSLVVLTYPFIYLQLFLGETVNIPYVDVLAMVTFLGVGIRLLVRWWNIGVRPTVGSLPGWIAFLVFLAAAALSLTSLASIGAAELLRGVKFLFRPLSFFYLMFIVLPLLVLDRPRRLFTTFRALFLVGGIAAVMGILSMLFPPEPGAFRRAIPITIFGVTPLGTNHNLIAEVLVSIIPIGVLLAVYARERARRWYVVGTVAYAFVALLTFSRNGWLTLAVEGIILGVALARERGMAWQRIARVAAPCIATAILAVGAFSTTTIARSSNRNRIALTHIALASWRSHPWVGGGVGTFVEAVRRDRWYLADFGEPQEAHGLVQKLLAEIGLLGLATFTALLASIVAAVVRAYRRAAAAPRWRFILLALSCSAAGSIIFQLFNTSYFVSKLWLPLGVAIAAARLAERGMRVREVRSGTVESRVTCAIP